MTTNNELLPCPFCGNTDIHIAPDEIGSGGQWVGPVHVVCGADCTAGQSGDDKESAIAAWNRRQLAVPANGELFWDADDPEMGERDLNDLVCQVAGNQGLRVGDIIDIQHAACLPNFKVRITSVDGDDSELDWEYVTHPATAQQAVSQDAEDAARYRALRQAAMDDDLGFIEAVDGYAQANTKDLQRPTAAEFDAAVDHARRHVEGE